MNINRAVSYVLVVALVATAVPIHAEESTRLLTLRDVIEQHCATKTRLTVELQDGSSISGMIGGTKKSLFYVLDGTPQARRTVAYAEVRMIADPATGERFLVQPPVTGRFPAVHTSWKAWMWFGIALGAVIIVGVILFHGEH